MQRYGVGGSGSGIHSQKNHAHLKRRSLLARSSAAVIEQLDPRRLLTVFTVTSTADTIANDGVVTLREAITAANTNAPSGDAPAGEPGLTTTDEIDFDLPGDGVHTISPTSALPAITDDLLINGENQNGDIDPAYMQISGNLAGNTVDGLSIQANNVTLENLVINQFTGNGISIHSAHGDSIQNDYIGTDPTGDLASPNGGDGILLDGVSSSTIGGQTYGYGADFTNLIAGNTGNGIELTNGSDSNNIDSNDIGFNVDDSIALANGKDGIHIVDSGDNMIGENDANTISANDGYGIYISGGSATNNIISQNTIGANGNDSSDGNALDGIYINGSHNSIGNYYAGNTIDGNGGNGIRIASGQFNSVFNDEISGNGVGTGDAGVRIDSPNNSLGEGDYGGNVIANNAGPGVELTSGAHDSQIAYADIGFTYGGNAAPNQVGILINSANNQIQNNNIAGNTGDGILIQGAGATGNRIQDNNIGQDSSSDILPNAEGVEIQSSGNSVGSSNGRDGNNIVGNSDAGVLISGNNNVVGDNDIGFIYDQYYGNTPAGNLVGVRIVGSASGNVIGGQSGFAGNNIADNGVGVSVEGSAVNNAILSNSIYDNVLLGIDLNDDGPTANDLGDADTGPNNLQNSPVIVSATATPLQTTISGSINSTAKTTLLIQFFTQLTSDGSGFGEGKTYLGQASVTTNNAGNASFTADFAQALVAGQVVSATATAMSGSTPLSTSEFSNAASVDGNMPTLTGENAEQDEGDHGPTEIDFNLELSSPINKTVTVDYATADGTATAPGDYIAQTGTITFQPGQTSATIAININGDTQVEDDETFAVNLSNAVNAELDSQQLVGTIDNDDFPPPPLVTINNVSHAEGDTNETEFDFTLTRTGDLSGYSRVECETFDGTADSETDYQSDDSEVTFFPGESVETFSVFVYGDTTPEPNETFIVRMYSDENAIVQGQGVGTIVDDDTPAPPPPVNSGTVSIVSDPTASGKKALRIEGTSKDDTITVTKSGSAQGKAIVKINGHTKGTFSFSGAILVYGDAGNDNITIDSAITRSAFIFGGDGKDTVSGGGGNDFISGDASSDSLKGNAGRDILVGGDSADKLDGGSDDDILIGGSFKTAPSFSQIASLLKELTRTDKNYATRVGHLRNGGGFNTIKLSTATLFSSANVKDSLTGGSGNDLFFGAIPGATSDKTSAETLVDIG